ncbi:hypothetical protein ACH518_15970 [Methylomonas sp. HW2-6]|uniref:hypothetical protein n=1 Tax=Methylomonas TaxID=416 RepID=UPI0011283850|nr:hypothetical protein [Methylomonas koyamae]TPQ24318.1 hypothetical protein C2U68_20445 [Methylomonas koyamae]
MNTHDSRSKPRRSASSRRLADRRQIPYPFASPQWLENIENAYLAWPKSDRRSRNTRIGDRRNCERRLAHVAGQARPAQTVSRISLTNEERRLIESLYSKEGESLLP